MSSNSWRILAAVLLTLGLACLSKAQVNLPLMGAGGKASSGCSMAFDAVSSNSVAGAAGGSPALSWTHTPVGTPTAVAIGIQYFPNGATLGTVTYGGTSMSLGKSVTDSNTTITAIYGLANPSSGMQTVAINASAGGAFIEAGSITVTCSNTTTVFDDSEATTGTSATPTLTTPVNSTTAEIVVDVLGSYTGGATFTPTGTGHVTKWGPLTAGGNRGQGGTMPGQAGTTSPTWSLSGGSTVFGLAAASFAHQ